MKIIEAQREMRTRFVGGFYGQLVSSLLWLLSAILATWKSPRAGIIALVAGGFLIYLITELLIRVTGERCSLSPANTLPSLGRQVAFVLPLSMPLLVPVTLYRQNWFYPGLTLLLGAHFLPFGFLYGMRMYGVLATMLVIGGMVIAMYWSSSFSVGGWYTGMILIVFAMVGREIANREYRDRAAHQRHAP